jgi:hypothetical protein
MQFHPLAYIVKLKIELSMAELIAKIAKNRDPNQLGGQGRDFYAKSGSNGGSQSAGTVLGTGPKNRAWATVTTTVEMKTMDARGKEVQRTGTTAFAHSDTDTLIDPGSSFSGSGPASANVVADRSRDLELGRPMGADRKDFGSISSFNSGSEGP